MAIRKELLEILVCPVCKGPLTLEPGEQSFVCVRCKVRYPIEDEIPNLVPSAGEPVD